MNVIQFKNARLIDPKALSADGGILTVVDGKIAHTIPKGAQPQIVDCRGMCLAPGIVDLGVKIGEPGERHKESFRSAGRAAAAGGVTTVIIRPDTSPAVDTPEMIEFIARRAAHDSIVHVVPMAALTKQRQGKEIAEIGFLMGAGAAAFTDCDMVSADTKVFARALTYARSLGALVIAHPQDPGLSTGAAATSGKIASFYGLPAVSALAEKMGLERDVTLIEMTGVKYHADQITTAAALGPLARAKQDGLDITAGTSIHHVTLNELDICGYRTFFKVKPPLRSEDDRLAIVEALATGVIDTLSSMHTPQDEESKRRPFEQAESGAVGLETFLPAALRLVHNKHLTLPQLWRVISYNPAKRLGLNQGRLCEGAPADLVVFDPDAPFVLRRDALLSKCKNTPFDGQKMQGRVLSTWVGGKCIYQAS